MKKDMELRAQQYLRDKTADGSAHNHEEYIHALRWDWLTALYDPVVRLTTRERMFKSLLLDQIGLKDGMRILDIGCGTGTLAIEAKRRVPGAEVVGLDGDAKILARARIKAEKAGACVQFEQATAMELPFLECTFDRAVSTLLFHHLTRRDKLRTLREILRVLCNDGELHLADWGESRNWKDGLLFLPVRLLDGFETTRDNACGDLPRLMESAGFADVVESRRVMTPLGPISIYSARKRAAESR